MPRSVVQQVLLDLDLAVGNAVVGLMAVIHPGVFVATRRLITQKTGVTVGNETGSVENFLQSSRQPYSGRSYAASS